MMQTLTKLIPIKSKCIFHSADENAFIQRNARSCTQNLYLQWLTPQKQTVVRWGKRQVMRDKGKVRDRLLEEACFKPGFEGDKIS